MIFIVLYIKLLAVESFPDIINTQVDFSMFHVTFAFFMENIAKNVRKSPNFSQILLRYGDTNIATKGQKNLKFLLH